MTKIPPNVMHEPKPMAWAGLTPMSEHKAREAAGIKPEIVPAGSRKKPLPISRATTDLRRAYPYLFDCAAYAKTHAPEKVEEDELFYAKITMPYEVFLEYCLDGCTEQTDYLKNEVYKLMSGERAKYIKVSKERTLFAQPIFIAFSFRDLKTGKERLVKNINQDHKVEMVQIQILKDLLNYESGYVNKPKAFYAKTRRIFSRALEIVTKVRAITKNGTGYRDIINTIKELATAPITTEKAASMAKTILEQGKQFEETNIEHGGFYSIYRAYEYILANKKKNIKSQTYDFLKLCEKCAPEYTREIDGKLYFDNKTAAFRYGLFICNYLKEYSPKDRLVIGIEKLEISNYAPEMTATFSLPPETKKIAATKRKRREAKK